MSSCIRKVKEEQGQATIESALLIPVLFILLLLLIQPGIILYTHMVMKSAASEACRLIATSTDAAGSNQDAYRAFVLRRLGAVPPQDNFHIHNDACSWDIEIEGNEGSEQVRVTIKNRLKLLPLFDAGVGLLGVLGSDGTYHQEVSVSAETQPEWVFSNEWGMNPGAWVKEDL